MVQEFSKQLLTETIKNNNIIILDFYAIWCGPCKNFGNIFNEVAEEMKDIAIFGKVNIDEQRDLAIEYKISSIPNIIIIKNGTLMWQQIGSIDAETLKNKIKKLL